MLILYFLSSPELPILTPFSEQITITSIRSIKQQNKDSEYLPQILELEPHKLLIIGFWRGFQDIENVTLYYGYEFRANGVYFARHRGYQGEETIFDQSWQGEWVFDGKLLRLTGSLITENSTIYRYQFRLEEDDFLYYQDGDLPPPYIPSKMGKQR